MCEGCFQKDPVKTVQCFEAVMLRKINFQGSLFKNLEGIYYYGRIEETIQFDKEADFDDKTSQNYVISQILTKDTLDNRMMLQMFPKILFTHPIKTIIVMLNLWIERRKKRNEKEVYRQCYFPNHPTKQNKIESHKWGNGGFFHLQKFPDGKWYIIKIR